MPEPENTREAFARGQVAGQVDARLTGHDSDLFRIHGSVDRMAVAAEQQVEELRSLALVVQRLIDKIDASDMRVIATAEALEKADIARRSKDDQSWSPLARWATAIGLIGALVTLAVVFIK